MIPERPTRKTIQQRFNALHRGAKLSLCISFALLVLTLCLCSLLVMATSTPAPNTFSTAQVVVTSTSALISSPTATQKALPSPTPTKPTPTIQHPTPTAYPTQPHPTPTPTPAPACQAVNNNPWCYNFTPGNRIYNPPAAFCDYFNCISNFWNGRGFVNECQDGSYSKSGGIRGDCSYHGGEQQPLYAH